MKSIQTMDYPTRFVAFDNPGVLVEAEDAERRCVMEWAIYHEPMKNRRHPDLEDGIYAEIIQARGNLRFVIDFHVTRPDASREQMGVAKIVNTYAECKALLMEWLPVARAFAGSIPSYMMEDGKRYTICITTRDGVTQDEATELAIKLYDYGYITTQRPLQRNSALFRLYARKGRLKYSPEVTV